MKTYSSWQNLAHFSRHLALVVGGLAVIGGCSACDETVATDPDVAGDTTATDTTEDTGNVCTTPAGEGLNTAHFVAEGLATPIQEVACTLSDGSETTCYQIAIKGAPADHEVGPFCPRNIADNADNAGLWIEDGKTFALSGAFIAGLADFYNDDGWLLYDPATGEVNVTDTQVACEGAAKPDVEEAYQNHCVECSLDYVGGGIAKTILIPKVPVPAPATSEIGGMSTVGVALNGVHFDPPAPVDAILAAYTIAAFDDCGGHVNTATGYHYHAATGCGHQAVQCDGHAPLIGYALDGYAIHAMTADDGVEPADLDACRGHSDATRGYHYHAASAGENMFIGCFRGLTVGTTDGPGGPGDTPGTCTDPPTDPCCGDGVCDGPETAANCAADCS